MRIALPIPLTGILGAAEAFGVWKLDPDRSTLAADEKSVTVRIQPHPRGEVFTVDSADARGRALTSSTLLHFDGKSRDFRDTSCSGTQSSRRVDTHTFEIVRDCESGAQVRLIRRVVPPKLLIFDITERQTGGRRSERRLVMEKQ